MKRSAVRELIGNEKVEFLCLQEIKLDYMDKKLASKLWGNTDCSWVFSGANGTSGGLCCIWDDIVFTRTELWGEKGVLGVSGLWNGCPVNIINVYSPCKKTEKRELWWLVAEKLQGREEERWCICGDFNAI